VLVWSKYARDPAGVVVYDERSVMRDLYLGDAPQRGTSSWLSSFDSTKMLVLLM
jgi:hypothetical protein